MYIIYESIVAICWKRSDRLAFALSGMSSSFSFLTWAQLFKGSLVNELVKKSARQVFYSFITKYTDIFC